jgi:formimidoylglutamate deiminase
MAFLEMALSGITTVGEFHYLHHAPEGEQFSDPDVLAKQVVQAARDIGLRIALLRVAYARPGYRNEANPRQARFIESHADDYLKRVSYLHTYLNTFGGYAWLGVAPHSVRAVPLDYLKQIIHFANERQLVVHMHMAEQRAEVLSCIEEYGMPPIKLLASEDLMNARFTAVHAIHVTSDEVMALAHTKSKVCACPTTERNLGDGIVPVDAFFKAGVPVCLGSDSHVQIDLLEDARELEYHLRLEKMERAVLASESGDRAELAARLFRCATMSGAASLGFDGGLLEQGHPADFFTVDLNDPSIAGSSPEDLLANVVFSLSRAAVRDVIVGGQTIVKDGHHTKQEEVVERFRTLQKRLWS